MNGSHRQGHGFEHRRGHRQKAGHEENSLPNFPEDSQNLSEEDQGSPGRKAGSGQIKNR